jgi:hypothetical protein
MQYWDTSTLLKLYVPEIDSAQFAAHVPNATIYSSELARWELLRAITRKEMELAIPPLSAETVFAMFRSDVNAGRVVLHPVDGAVETQFRTLVLTLHRQQPPTFIRTFDAIHLATAMLLSATEVATADVQMRNAAIAIGLKVFP